MVFVLGTILLSIFTDVLNDIMGKKKPTIKISYPNTLQLLFVALTPLDWLSTKGKSHSNRRNLQGLVMQALVPSSDPAMVQHQKARKMCPK